MKEIQALALTTISRMVQLAGAPQIRPHLPQLVATMLESLSGMEASNSPPPPLGTGCSQHKRLEASSPSMVGSHAVFLQDWSKLCQKCVQDSRINYVEQHVEAMGLDSGRLESLRVAAASASPMADTLDLCVRYTDAATLQALLPRLLQLVKSGLGLNTMGEAVLL